MSLKHFWDSSKTEHSSISAAITNTLFLSKYNSHIIHKWKHKYINVDNFVAECKFIRHEALVSSISIEHFDNHFRNEIEAVDRFVGSSLSAISKDIDSIKDEWEHLSEDQRFSIIHRRQADKKAERSLRELHAHIQQTNSFWKLNKFAMNKIGLKMTSILEESAIPVHYYNRTLASWTDLNCFHAFESFCCQANEIEALSKRCSDLFSTIFAVDRTLAESCLEYDAAKDTKSKYISVLLGVKIGISLAMIGLIFFEAFSMPALTDDFWWNPGVFVYSAIGSILLFKLCWSLSVWIWIEYHIDYISVFKVANISPNLLAIVNETMTLVAAYFISFFIYLLSNDKTGFRSTSTSHILSPFLLIIFALCFWIVKLFRVESLHQSRGLFSAKVFWHCLVAPTNPVAFRDGFAADALTSFNKIISDSLYGTCWLVVLMFPAQTADSSSASDFDVSLATCTTTTMSFIVACGTMIPLWIRFSQCMRQFWDRNVIFPPFLNALKYALSMLVVVYSLFGPRPSGIFSSYYLIVVAATLYKWWWDVVMDWGLFWLIPVRHDKQGSSPTILRKQFLNIKQIPTFSISLCWLRPHLIFEYSAVYYAAIIIDLVLRFIWVLSLEAPRSSFPIPALSIFLGMLEVVRRSMWGVLRVEYEFISSCMNKSLGVPESKVFKYLFDDDQKL